MKKETDFGMAGDTCANTGAHGKHDGTRRGHPALATLRAYWEALRDGRDMPARAEIDPRGIENALAHAFIAERIAPGIARFRISGLSLNDIMGMELRGMPMTALIEPEARHSFMQDLEQVFAAPAIMEFRLASAGRLMRPALAGRMLLMPLRSPVGAVGYALGGLVLEGRLGRVPRRLEPRRDQMIPVSARRTAPARETLEPEPAHGEFAEQQAEFTPAAERDAVQHPPRRRKPYLRLVKSD